MDPPQHGNRKPPKHDMVAYDVPEQPCAFDSCGEPASKSWQLLYRGMLVLGSPSIVACDNCAEIIMRRTDRFAEAEEIANKFGLS